MSGRKLNIFHLLNATDQCDGDWLSRQPDDARKEFAPLVAMRWAATVTDGITAGYMLYMINERVNEHLFDFARHPDLSYRLMASCGLKVSHKHQYLTTSSASAPSNAAVNLLRVQFPHASDGEINLLLSLFQRASFVEYVNECGVQPDEAKRIIHAFEQLRPEEARQAKTKAKT